MTRLLPALLLLAACVPPPPPPRTPAPAAAPVTAPVGALEREVHTLVNQRRAQRGLAALVWDDRIAAAAREHSAAMAARRRNFGHAGFPERVAAMRAALPVAGAAENVAYDSRTGPGLAGRVVQGWIRSAGHRQNLEGDFQRAGVGIARAPTGVYYFTQIFAAVRR